MRKSKPCTSFLFSLALVLGSLSIAETCEARTRSGRISTSRGGSGTYSRTRTGNSNSVNGSFTGAGGRFYSVQGGGAYDPATKSYSGSRTLTGPRGQQRTYDVQKQFSGTGSQVNTYTGPQGNTAQVNINRSYDPDTQSVNKTITGPTGNSATFTGQRVYNPETGTYSYVQTGPRGGTVEVSPNQ